MVADAVGADLQDAGAPMGGFGHDPHLRSGHGDGGNAPLVQGHGQQGDGDLFSAGQEHVHLPLRWTGADRRRQPRQLIGGVSHGRHHHHHAIAGVAAPPDPFGDGLDAFDAADGGAAELLHQEDHGPGFSNAGLSHSAHADWNQPSKPSRKASPGRAPRLSRASTSSSRLSRDRKRFAGRPCSCLRIT